MFDLSIFQAADAALASPSIAGATRRGDRKGERTEPLDQGRTAPIQGCPHLARLHGGARAQ